MSMHPRIRRSRGAFESARASNLFVRFRLVGGAEFDQEHADDDEADPGKSSCPMPKMSVAALGAQMPPPSPSGMP